jgi:hypothetical protein
MAELDSALLRIMLAVVTTTTAAVASRHSCCIALGLLPCIKVMT